MIRGVAYVAGVPAVGHVSGVGTFHAGPRTACPSCKTTINTHATQSRGANLVNDTTTPADLASADAAGPARDEAQQPPASGLARFKIRIGYTKVVHPAEGEGFGYVPMADGYRRGAEQHVITITVDLNQNLQPYRIAELVFIATNAEKHAEELEPDSPEELIRLAIEDTGYKGEEAAHFSLSVGDTVQVGDGPRLACEASGWTEVK